VPSKTTRHCTLCGQEMPEFGPCGCGKRVTKDVTIPRSKLREWRRGLLVAGDNCTTCGTNGLGQHHACEILEEIEGYLNGG